MIWPFRRKKKPNAPPPLSRAEAQYRQQRINDVVATSGRDRADVEKLLDTWTIGVVTSRSGDGPPVKEYLPYPLWDDEAMISRNSFPTLGEALAEVSRHGGTLPFDPAEHFAQPDEAGE